MEIGMPQLLWVKPFKFLETVVFPPLPSLLLQKYISKFYKLVSSLCWVSEAVYRFIRYTLSF